MMDLVYATALMTLGFYGLWLLSRSVAYYPIPPRHPGRRINSARVVHGGHCEMRGPR